MSWFDLGFARCFLLPYLRRFSYHNDMWIASSDYCMYYYLIVLSLLTAILQLMLINN